MKRRPWPIIILAFIQILMPFFNILMNAWLENVSPDIYFRAFVHFQPPAKVATFFLLYLISGAAIFLMKKWSYAVFLLITSWNILSNIIIWVRDYYPSSHSLWTDHSFWILVLANLTNIAFVTYYLLPSVRKVYFDRTVRWWESKPRFLLKILANFQQNKNPQSIPCTICDLSMGGAFIETSQQLAMGDTITLSIPLYDRSIQIKSTVIHKREGNSSPEAKGYGLQFQRNPETDKKIKNLTACLRSFGFPLRWEPESTWESFVDWAKKIFSKQAWLPLDH